MTNALKAIGQDMEQEAANEFLGFQGHDLSVVVMAVILPMKGDAIVDVEQAVTNRYITVQRRWYRGTFSTPKGGKPRRVDMSRELRSVLLRLRSERLQEAASRGSVSIADDLLFPGENGNPLRARKLLESYFVRRSNTQGLAASVFTTCVRHSEA